LKNSRHDLAQPRNLDLICLNSIPRLLFVCCGLDAIGRWPCDGADMLPVLCNTDLVILSSDFFCRLLWPLLDFAIHQ